MTDAEEKQATAPEIDMDLLRRFAGEDPDADPRGLEFAYRSAVEWFEKCQVPQQPDSYLWQFWVMSLTAWMYDNRGDADAAQHVPAYIVNALPQLKRYTRKPRRKSP